MKKGISMIVLTMSVVVMLILATTATISGVAASNNYKKIRFATEIAYIKQMVNSYYNLHDFSYPIGDSISVDISKLSISSKDQFKDEDMSSNKVVLYKIDKTLIGKNETVYGNEKSKEDIYALSTKTGKVYYIKGIKAANTTYYTLTKDLEKTINYDDIESINGEDNISFVNDPLEYTNKKITSTIKVPNTYSSVSFESYCNGTLFNQIITQNISDGNGFYSYTTEPNAKNYDIIISYTKNKTRKKQVLNVNNFDNEAPNFTVSTPLLINETGSNKKQYNIEITSKSDNLSGIKIIKYEKEKINDNQIQSYFQSNGYEVKDNMITVDAITKDITIFVEDNAGNFKYHYISINI
ncbi:MAG: hypothetical protein RSB67_03270 [Clostridia bacterium]